MMDEKNEVNVELSAQSFTRNPETVDEMLNSYGTYNIQPTALSENDFPAIAQGETERMKKRSHTFFRGHGDENPAADNSDKRSF